MVLTSVFLWLCLIVSHVEEDFDGDTSQRAFHYSAISAALLLGLVFTYMLATLNDICCSMLEL